MKVVILDGYIDEPASLGVPPYSSPLLRATAGAAISAGSEVMVVTIDHVRRGSLPEGEVLVVLGGTAVPGRYLRAAPASGKEIIRIASNFRGNKLLGGPAALDDTLDKRSFNLVSRKDPAAMLFDFLNGLEPNERWRTPQEWEDWLRKGASAVMAHPDFPQPLIAEIETFRGCVRYSSGGCSFCVEPLKGKPVHRRPKDIILEVKELHRLGVRNFRLGAQTCFLCYMSEGESETPTPNPQAVDELLQGINALGVDVLHLDNANPAVIATHAEKSAEILHSIVRYCTSGNVLALGLESADPAVAEANNLNATPEQTLEAIKLINQIGREIGPTGLPKLLPGLNFIIGLDGESKETLRLNLEFLREVRREGLWLRRINIRQVSPIRRHFKRRISHSDFLRFKEKVRLEIDKPLLQEMLPLGSRLSKVYTEIYEGNHTFGRQVGTYPILVGFEYPLQLGRFVDCKVVGWGERSVTAVEYPLDPNTCPLAALASLPSIGLKRASRLVKGRPYSNLQELASQLDDSSIAASIAPFLSLGD
ncbi:MAG: radical SAM protein [Methanomassiliicoccales archaeon]